MNSIIKTTLLKLRGNGGFSWPFLTRRSSQIDLAKFLIGSIQNNYKILEKY